MSVKACLASVLATVVLLSSCGGSDDPRYETPEQVAEAIGATPDGKSTDDGGGLEVSAQWRGESINIWVAHDSAAFETGLAMVDSMGFPYAAGDGWVITAGSQRLADRAAAAANSP